MKFACEQCQTKYNLPDERVRGKILKIRCKKCASLITVSEGGARTTKGEDPAKDAPAMSGLDDQDSGGGESTMIGGMADFFGKGVLPTEPDEWHVSIDGNMNGPLPLSEVASRIVAEEKVPGREIFVWREGFGDWLPPASVDDIKKAVEKARKEAPKKPAPAPAPAASLASDDGGDATQIGALNLPLDLASRAPPPEPEEPADIEPIEAIDMVSDQPAPPKPKAPPPPKAPPAFKAPTPAPAKPAMPSTPAPAVRTPAPAPQPAAERPLPPPPEPVHIPESEPTGNLADLIRAKGLNPGSDPLVALGLKKDELHLPGIDGAPPPPPQDIGVLSTVSDQEPKKASKLPLIGGLVALLVLVGGGVFVLTKSGKQGGGDTVVQADGGSQAAAKPPEPPKPDPSKTDAAKKDDPLAGLSGLTPDEFKGLLEAGDKALSSCYTKALKKEPTLKGTRLNVSAEVNAKGKADDVSVGGTDPEGKLGKCVTKAVKKWKYPKGKEQKVSFALTVKEP